MLIICILCLSGCWDKIEIEDRLFVLAMGVDKTKEEEQKTPVDSYTFTFAAPVVNSVKEGEGPAFNSYKSASSTLIMSLTKLLERFSQVQFFGHCRAVIFGEDVLKDEKLFKGIIDAMMRYHELHGSMYTFVTQGKAEEIFKVEPLYDKLVGSYISGIAENSEYIARIVSLSLGELFTKLDSQNGSVVIPRVSASKEELDVLGAGVVKNYKLIGYMDEQETIVYNWLTNNAKGGTIAIEFKDASTAFRHYTFSRRIEMDKIADGKIYLNYNMETEGSIEEFQVGKEILDAGMLAELERHIEKKIEDESKKLARKFQEEYKVDLIGVRDFLSKYYPGVYKSVEKDFDQYFQDNIIINVTAQVKIRRVGLIR